MNHVHHLFVIILSFVIPFTGYSRTNQSSDPTAIQFFEGTLPQLKAKAQAEQKPYMVYFYTDWCEPCQTLSNETLSSEKVSRYLNAHYLTFKIDADVSTRGEEALADQFNVDLFPTILIFASTGELIDQFHGFKSPDELLIELSLVYDDNVELESETESVPELKPLVITHTPKAKAELEILDYHYVPKAEEGIESSDDSEFDSRSIDMSQSLSTVEVKDYPSSSQSLPRGDGLYRMEIQRHNSAGYAVQIGVFKEYQNAIFKMEQSKMQFDQEMLMNVNSLNNEPVFKIMYGPFPTMPEAKAFMKDYQRETQQASILVDLSWFK